MKRLAATLILLALVAGGIWWLTVDREPGSRAKNSPTREEDEKPAPDLRGTVTDSSGEPVEGASVILRSDDGERETETGASGTYIFDELPAATYRLDLRSEGHVPPGPRPLRELSVELAPAGARDGAKRVDLNLHEPARLTGRVVAGDEPAGGVRLSIYYLFAEGFQGGLDPFTLSNEATTDATGRFSLENVAPGRLRLIAESEDHPARRSRELLIEAGESRDGIVIDLEPQGVLSGKVVGRGGDPLPARLTVSSGRLASSRSARADSNGNFRIARLPEGSFRLMARAPGHRSRVLENVEVRSDETTHRAITLEPGDGIFGRVVGPEGQPVPRAFVRLERDGKVRWERADEDGKFTWRKAPGGVWSARAVSPRHASSASRRAEPKRSLRLQVGEGGYVRGRLVDSAGDPVSGARVGVAAMVIDGPRPYGPRAAGIEKVDASDGRFRFGPLRPGRYRLQAKKSGYAPASSPQLTVEAGRTSGEIELVFGLGGTVAGVVRSKASGTPIAGARVSAFDMTSPFQPRRTKTDRRGRFKLERIPSGRRSLQIKHGQHLTRVVSGLQVPAGGSVQKDVTLTKKKKGQKFGFRGIGASLQRTDRGVQIRRIIPGGGAEKQGLKKGDVIRAVDRQSVDGLSLSRIVQTIRGQGGEPVQLTVERDGRGKFRVEIIRDRVVVEGRGRN